ncbi:hypothetical protein MKX03_007229 [Papaver bracteatum]|nr:hypothetical protein MKX03_007229 [Papaver bracteatum]
MEEGVGGEDRISRLPEPIIRHILTLLPTKCAVATTVLSRGWNNLWISLPVLDFREWKSPDTEATQSSTNSFVDFVDRVLSIRNMSEIKKFCLTSDGRYFDDRRIKAWITTAIQCRVEELIVNRNGINVDIIPVDVYTCESLKLLDIDLYGGQHLNLPQLISFPRLKILQLDDISVYRQRNIQQLFSNCPVLEELCLKHCFLNHLNIISSTLKSLTFFSTFHSSMSNIKIMIDAPNLMSIKIHDGIPRHFVVGSFPSLEDADISRMYTEESVPVDVIPKFVEKLSNVKLLKLSDYVFEKLELAGVLSTRFPTFNNLITLEVSFIKTQLVEPLFSFLQFSPNLESLVFNGVCRDKANDEALTLDGVPRCLLMHLKSIKFRYYEGQLEELDLVQLFLQNARVLQTVIIEISSDHFVNSDKKTHNAEDVEDFNKKIMEQLLKYKWASTDCAIKLCSF